MVVFGHTQIEPAVAKIYVCDSHLKQEEIKCECLKAILKKINMSSEVILCTKVKVKYAFGPIVAHQSGAYPGF